MKSPTKKQNTRTNSVPVKTEAAKKIENLIFNFNHANKDKRLSGGGSVDEKDKRTTASTDITDNENYEGGVKQHKQPPDAESADVKPPVLKKIPKKVNSSSPKKTFKDSVELLPKEKGLASYVLIC